MSETRTVAEGGAWPARPSPGVWAAWLGLDRVPSVDLNLAITRLPTPLGPMVAVADETALLLLEFCDRRALVTQLKKVVRSRSALPRLGDNRVLGDTLDQLEDYFEGRRRHFTVPLEPVGTPFQQRAWEALAEIQHGQLSTYRRQAERLGVPGAVRAVGNANGANPVSILIPCHRLVGSDGSLTGYGGGLWRKQALIDLEGGARVPAISLDQRQELATLGNPGPGAGV